MSGGALARSSATNTGDEARIRITRCEHRKRIHEAAGRLTVGQERSTSAACPHTSSVSTGAVCARMYVRSWWPRPTRPAVSAQSAIAEVGSAFGQPAATAIAPQNDYRDVAGATDRIPSVAATRAMIANTSDDAECHQRREREQDRREVVPVGVGRATPRVPARSEARTREQQEGWRCSPPHPAGSREGAVRRRTNRPAGRTACRRPW